MTLDPDPLRPPDDDRIPHPPETRIGRWALLLVVAVVVLVALFVTGLAAPRPSSEPSGAGATTGAPPKAAVVQEGGDYLDRRSSARPPVLVTLPAAATLTTEGSQPVAEPIRTPTPAPTAEVGAVYSASATWCKPTATMCQSWGGDARLGAVFGFRFGDAPYWVRVWRGERFADVLIVSHCACRGTDAAIDLSPAAFTQLAPLSRGRIAVAVEVLTWPGDSDDPPPHPSDERMREEVR